MLVPGELDRLTLRWLQTRVGWVQTAKNVYFRPINRHISEAIFFNVYSNSKMASLQDTAILKMANPNPNPNPNPSYAGPSLWRPFAMAGRYQNEMAD